MQTRKKNWGGGGKSFYTLFGVPKRESREDFCLPERDLYVLLHMGCVEVNFVSGNSLTMLQKYCGSVAIVFFYV